MRLRSAFLVLCGHAATLAAAGCAADNCYRAVAATSPTTRHASADCSSFLKATVTPATVTVTATATNTITPTVTVTDTTIIMKREADHPLTPHAPVLEVRQVTVHPTSIPTYASLCSGAVRYSSACSCIGVTATTITASAPTTTITRTANAPAKTVTQCSGPQPTFVLQAVLSGDPTNGLYAQSQNPGQQPDYLNFATSSLAQANIFILTTAGYLETMGTIASLDESESPNGILYFNTPAYVTSNQLVAAICSISSSNVLSCNAGGENMLFACTGTIVLGSSEPTTYFGCVNPVFQVVPLCTPKAS